MFPDAHVGGNFEKSACSFLLPGGISADWAVSHQCWGCLNHLSLGFYEKEPLKTLIHYLLSISCQIRGRTLFKICTQNLLERRVDSAP